ncbi:putative prolin-rich extensin-like receptor protein kinase family protein [Iris pallida]|uniref:non-specific serine/threonine protein kinase n=1 Tax=Iris pallida TaxID=29817 RepID=A0AAX6IHX7_IRIPA|nr:putative prolin-rich extensin-like receptor protein kinase family protein [Iris pallida]
MSAPAPSTTNSTAPPPSTPSAPPPSTPSVPPPSTNSTSPPPSTPSAPPPSTPSAPPPSTPSAPPPSTPTAPPPSNSISPPPPLIPSPSPPAPSTPSTSPPAPSGKSPPSPPSAKSPPPPSHSPPSSSSKSTPTVVGIAVGAVVILAVVSLICICCCRKRRRRRRSRPSDDYYGGAPPPPPPQMPSRKDEPYGGAQWQNWQNNAPPPADHLVKIPPQPPAPPPYASRPPISSSGYSTPPPPPPPVFSSSGGSGSNYSGSENPLPPPSPGLGLGFSKSIFTFEELAMATDGFSDANLLGQGGFGFVHKGMLPNGKEVAIKQLKIGSGQGEREFQAEIDIISRVHHKHLVSLVGYCMSGRERLLVYEFVPNGTLEFHLHGKDRPTMDWPTRLKIALGSAKGLAYLHEDCHPKIIHRDIKAANILLDFKCEAKVADFGLAKFASDNNTHVSTRVMGTFGYMAPEYASTGKLTDRSDVFSFGVMLLELITGKRPVDSNQTYVEDSLVDWARPLLTRALEDGNYDTLVDRNLGRNYNPNEMARMVACAASCVRHSARRRPRMSQIVRALEGDVSLEDLNEGIKPGHSTLYSSYGSSDYDASQYNEDMKKFRKMALASKDYTSSEYSAAPTSEYGQIPSASSSEGRHTREMETGKMKNDGA